MAEEKNDQQQEAPKKSKLPLFIGIGVLVLGGGGFAAFKMMGSSPPPAAAGTPAAAPAPVQIAEVAIPLDTFVVNLADNETERFMKVTMQAVVTDATLRDRFEEEPLARARVRDRVLGVISSYTFNDIATPTGKEMLRSEIAREMGVVLNSEGVKEILFTEFVIQ